MRKTSISILSFTVIEAVSLGLNVGPRPSLNLRLVVGLGNTVSLSESGRQPGYKSLFIDKPLPHADALQYACSKPTKPVLTYLIHYRQKL